MNRFILSIQVNMKYIKSNDDIHIWNGVRYLGRLYKISTRYFFVAPSIKQTHFASELREIADKMDELNNDNQNLA